MKVRPFLIVWLLRVTVEVEVTCKVTLTLFCFSSVFTYRLSRFSVITVVPDPLSEPRALAIVTGR